MPNWTDNQLIISGDAAERARFTEAVTNPDGSITMIANLVPFPPELEGEEINLNGKSLGPSLTREGYEWRLENWGTKWSDANTTLAVEGDAHVLHFMTPWSAPLAAMATISAAFPALTFEISSVYEDDPSETWTETFVAGEIQ